MTGSVNQVDKKDNPLKILLVQSYLGGGEYFKVYPLGLVSLASCLRNHDVRICDLNLYENPYLKLEEELTGYKPDIVGISLRNIDNQDRINIVYYYKDFITIIRKIKTIKPDIQLVVGGAGYSSFARQIMERNIELDFGVYLEGEETFPHLLDNLDKPETVKGVYYRQNGEVKFAGKRRLPDLNDLLPIQRKHLGMSLYPSSINSIGVESKRGCAFNCSYCNYSFLNGNKVRTKQPEKVVDEIEEILNSHGINEFTFVDSIFNVPLGHASAICHEIIRRKLKVSWNAYMDIGHADEEFLLLCRDAGCTGFLFSPDGMSNNTLKSLHKGITVEKINRVCRLFKTHERLKNIFVLFTLMLNPPDENLRSLLKTLWFYIWNKYSLMKRGDVTISWIRIEPETEIHKLALANGAIKPDTNLLPEQTKELEDVFYSHPPLKHIDTIIISFRKVARLLTSKLKGEKR